MDFQVGTKRKHTREMNSDEEDLIARMHRLIGDRWALIAGRIPGRTAQEIEVYWKSKKQKKAANEAPVSVLEPKAEASIENIWVSVAKK